MEVQDQELAVLQEEKVPVNAQTNDDDVTAQDLCVLLKLPPNMKGWLGGVQKEYIEQAHLLKFLAIYAEDPSTGKELAYAAATALLKKYDWRLPFNQAPTSDYDLKEVLSPEDALMRAAVLLRTKNSLLTWMRAQASRVGAPKKSTSDNQDHMSSLIRCFASTESGILHGRSAYQAWAKDQEERLSRKFDFDDTGPSRTRMGARSKACSDAFRELPEEEQQHWRAIVAAERLAAMDEREEIRSKMGEHLPPAQAQKMLDRVPGLLGPICKIISEMAMTNITILFGGPEPRAGGKINVSVLNYGSLKDDPPQKFSGNTERFNRCMRAFGEFVGECFDEADKDSRALPDATADPEDGESSVQRAITYRGEIDHNIPMEGEEVDALDGEPGEEAEEVPKSKKKRAGGKKRKSAGDDDDESGEKESGKKKKKKNGKEAPVFAESVRGRRKKDVLPATSMNTHQALEQISNTLAKVMPPAGPVISTPPDAEAVTVSSNPTDLQALQVVIATPASAIPVAPVSGSGSPDKEGVPSESRMVIDPALIDPALLNWTQPQANLGESSGEPGTTEGADGPSSTGVEASAPAGTDGDVSWLYKYVPVTGPNDTPNPFAVPGMVVGHVPPQAPSPTLPQASAAPSFADAALLDGSKWEGWFKKARAYLDAFELGEEWSYMIARFTLLEGRRGFKIGTGTLPNYKIRPEEVAWWSGRARTRVPALDRKGIARFEKAWWQWWRKLQPEWRSLDEGCAPISAELRPELPPGEWGWGVLDCPGQNGLYTILATIAWWKVGIDGLSGTKGRMLADWEMARDDVSWVLTVMTT